MNTYIYLGTSTRESRRKLLNIGCAMGAQHIRKKCMYLCAVEVKQLNI